MRKILYIMLCTFILSALSLSAVPVYQINTIAGLKSGIYQQILTVKQAKNENINFAVGAGVGLNEVVVLDGKYYQFNGTGHGKLLTANSGMSFLTGVNFTGNVKQHAYMFVPRKKFKSLNDIEQFLNKKIEQITNVKDFANIHEYFAIRIDGEFENIPLRSEDKVSNSSLHTIKKLVSLSDWLQSNHQHFFHKKHISGTMVGFFTPGINGQEISNSKGAYYHFHFVASKKFNNKFWGGHVLEGKSTGKVTAFNRLRITMVPFNSIAQSFDRETIGNI